MNEQATSQQSTQATTTPLQTQDNNVFIEQSFPKRFSIKKLLLILTGIPLCLMLLLVCFALFSSRVLHKDLHVAVTPKALPAGFVRRDEVQSEKDENGRYFLFMYQNQNGSTFNYQMQYNVKNPEKCTPPETSSTAISNFHTFRPKDSTDGCVMNLTHKDGSVTKVYKWLFGNSQFIVSANNPTFTDQEMLDLSNSLKAEFIFIGNSTSPISN